jgi:hypothetical protein
MPERSQQMTLRSLGDALEGERIAEITAFVVRRADIPDGYARWLRFIVDPERVESVFRRFGLPDRID